MIYDITIPGRPQGKARPRLSRAGGVYTPSATKRYENTVKAIFIEKYGKPRNTGIIAVGIYAVFPIAKGISKSKKLSLDGSNALITPDVDNIAKIILDALNGIAYIDDKQIAELIVTKKYGLSASVSVIISTEDIEGG